AVVEPHWRPERVEDPHDASVDPVGTVVRHGHRLAEPLGLVIDSARADRIDMAPVVLAWGVHEGVAVDFRSRGEQEARALRFGHAQCVMRTEGADFQGLNGQLEVVEGRCRAGEVKHPVEMPIEADVLGYVVLGEREAGSGDEAGEVLGRPGDEIVHADDVPALTEEVLAEMRADEPCATGDQDAHSSISYGWRTGLRPIE